MRSLSLSLFLLISSPVFAAGGGEEKPADAAPLPKDTKEFIEKSGRLTSLTNRIEEQKRKFSEVVNHKALAKTPAEKQVHIKELITITNEMNKDIEAYNRIKMDLKLRYPNQGEQLERRYQTQSKRTVEEMEGAAGLDELLTRTKKVIDKKYAPFLEEEEQRTQAKPEVPAGQDEKPKRLRLER